MSSSEIFSDQVNVNHVVPRGFITAYYSDTKSKGSGEKTTESEAYSPPKIEFSSKLLPDAVKMKLAGQLRCSWATGRREERRIFYGVDAQLPYQVAVTSLGSPAEDIYEKREAIRRAAAAGIRGLQAQGVKDFIVDPASDAQAAMEGAVLASYSYTKFEERRRSLVFSLLGTANGDDEHLLNDYKAGLLLGASQNMARYLADSPANKCTPTAFSRWAQHFADHVVRPRWGTAAACPLIIDAKDAQWAEKQGMRLFLSVSQGSYEPPQFLIMEYRGGAPDSKPIALVGKGVTFDSGGISIKPSAGMAAMKADMQGAAVVATTLLTAAYLKLPLHLAAVIPLTENLPSGTATKPGDIVIASNDKTIEIDNTDAEGRLILADALIYAAKTFRPSIILDAATLTGAIDVALGFPCSAVFTKSDTLYQELEAAGLAAGDRVWRMPLWDDYRAMMDSSVADLTNSSGSRSAGACTAAAFLQEFVSDDQTWVHLDIAGAMETKSEQGALGKGMTGRPTRMLLYWLFEQCRKTLPPKHGSEDPVKVLIGCLPNDALNAFTKYIIPF